MSPAELLEALSGALRDPRRLARRAAAGAAYFRRSSFAWGTRYWAAMVQVWRRGGGGGGGGVVVVVGGNAEKVRRRRRRWW